MLRGSRTWPMVSWKTGGLITRPELPVGAVFCGVGGCTVNFITFPPPADVDVLTMTDDESVGVVGAATNAAALAWPLEKAAAKGLLDIMPEPLDGPIDWDWMRTCCCVDDVMALCNKKKIRNTFSSLRVCTKDRCGWTTMSKINQSINEVQYGSNLLINQAIDQSV